MKMIKGQNYLLESEKGECRCKLTNIQTYPATGMPPDYRFTPLEGEAPLFSHEHFYPSFPIPYFLISRAVVAMLDDNGEELSKAVLEEMSITEILDELENIQLDLYSGRFEKLSAKLPKKWTNDQDALKGRYINIMHARLDELKKKQEELENE